jgi:hypothetical protein
MSSPGIFLRVQVHAGGIAFNHRKAPLASTLWEWGQAH